MEIEIEEDILKFYVERHYDIEALVNQLLKEYKKDYLRRMNNE